IDLMTDQPGAKNPNSYYPFTIGGNFQGVLSGDGKWKLHVPHKYRTLVKAAHDGLPGQYKNLSIELSLFDMENDPEESTNVIDKFPEVADRMKKLAEAHRAEFFPKQQKVQ
ncbi:MAG: arylsulfatase, partial [Verrucomicrobiota bacterium]